MTVLTESKQSGEHTGTAASAAACKLPCAAQLQCSTEHGSAAQRSVPLLWTGR